MTMQGTNSKISTEFFAPIILLYSRILVAIYVFGYVVWYGMAEGLKDKSGTVFGADFISVYAAGLVANQGRATLAYNGHLHHLLEQDIAGYAFPSSVIWIYPPIFLGVACLFALLPYLYAFILYMVAGFAGYWAVMRRLIPQGKQYQWAALAFPGTFTNIVNGQNGFITTILFGAGIIGLEKRPWVSGILLGLLAYKPQFFVVIPFILAVGGYWRSFLASCLTALLSSLVSWAIFGTETWQAFYAAGTFAQHYLLERDTGDWYRLQSVFSLMRLADYDASTAYTAQTIVAAISVLCAALVWRTQKSLAIKVASLTSAMLLSTPYLIDYDLVILAVPIALYWKLGMEEGFRPYERLLLGLLWLLPLLARKTGMAHILITPPLLLLLMIMCLRRRRHV